MKKFLTFLGLLLLAPLIAAIYGILHDQLTYSISAEYYTKFKFLQFGIPEEMGGRTGAAVVGFWATWWMGLPLGVILSGLGLLLRPWQHMLRTTVKTYGVVMAAAFFTGLVGLVYGFTVLSPQEVAWTLPPNLQEPQRYVAVGSMHNFSYIGGATGLVAGIIYLLKGRRKNF